MFRVEAMERSMGLRKRLFRLQVETVADSINRRHNLLEDRRLNEDYVNSSGERLGAVTNRREKRLRVEMIRVGTRITDKIDRELDKWPRLSRGVVFLDNDRLRIPLPEARRPRRAHRYS